MSQRVSKKQVVPVLVFAKAFERALFFLRISSSVLKVSELEVGCSKWNTTAGALIVKCIDDSDIGFLAGLISFVHNFRAFKGNEDVQLQLSMIGTCGGRKDMELDSVYQISQVRKLDRGVLKLKKAWNKIEEMPVRYEEIEVPEFQMRGDKVRRTNKAVNPIAEVGASQGSLRPMFCTAYSSNFLVECDIKHIQIRRDDEHDQSLQPDTNLSFDMESYDFVTCCQLNEVPIGFLLRVVSDNLGSVRRCSFKNLHLETVSSLLLGPRQQLYAKTIIDPPARTSVLQFFADCILMSSRKNATLFGENDKRSMAMEMCRSALTLNNFDQCMPSLLPLLVIESFLPFDAIQRKFEALCTKIRTLVNEMCVQAVDQGVLPPGGYDLSVSQCYEKATESYKAFIERNSCSCDGDCGDCAFWNSSGFRPHEVFIECDKEFKNYLSALPLPAPA